jgi:Protein of unknown function (DUF3455)
MTARLFQAGLIAGALLVSGAAYAQDRITPPSVPAEIELSSAYKVFFFGHAVGTQNYMCAPAATASGVDWFLIGPQATLFDSSGEQVVTHFLSKNPLRNDALQATWQHSRDSSKVWATRLNGAVVAPDAIEWLLLEVTGPQAGPSDGVKLTGAVRIHRVNTVGGMKPPATECTPATINTRKFVPYEADYYFYK